MIRKTETVSDLQKTLKHWKQSGRKIGFVPTMGALHEGHLSLVRLAKHHADHVVVSIFINPKQFGPGEDLSNYPRDADGDLKKLAGENADMVYMPGAETLYPPDFRTSVTVSGLPDCLCGLARPGHFQGVTTVVCVLLMQMQPDVAVFGQKDYQQLVIVKQMVRDLCMPVEIIGGPIVRDAHGLALSSRNQYLSQNELAMARTLNTVMDRAIRDVKSGTPVEKALETGQQNLIQNGFSKIDYFEIRSCHDLRLQKQLDDNSRLFAAANLGKTRLIDNKPFL